MNVMVNWMCMISTAVTAEGRLSMIEPMKCKCGADARVRKKGEYVWVECSSKKCDMRSGYVHFIHDKRLNVEEISTDHAISLWNKEVSK